MLGGKSLVRSSCFNTMPLARYSECHVQANVTACMEDTRLMAPNKSFYLPA